MQKFETILLGILIGLLLTALTIPVVWRVMGLQYSATGPLKFLNGIKPIYMHPHCSPGSAMTSVCGNPPGVFSPCGPSEKTKGAGSDAVAKWVKAHGSKPCARKAFYTKDPYIRTQGCLLATESYPRAKWSQTPSTTKMHPDTCTWVCAGTTKSMTGKPCPPPGLWDRPVGTSSTARWCSTSPGNRPLAMGWSSEQYSPICVLGNGPQAGGSCPGKTCTTPGQGW